MPAARFVDTNVLLYAVSTDPRDAAKVPIAQALLGEPDLALSAQVLQEFYVQATRASRLGALSHAQARTLVVSFLRYPVQDLTTPIVLAASETAERFRIGYWDAAILEAARAMGCRDVLSEDLAHGQDYGGVIVTNPFAA
jgi:predicted nucleic acid-binding protein